METLPSRLNDSFSLNHLFGFRSVISTIIPLPMGLNSTLNLRNCATRFVQSKNKQNYLHLRGWIHLMEPSVEAVAPATHSDSWKWDLQNNLHIFMQMKDSASYFQCIVTFNLNPDFYFDSLIINSEPVERYVDIYSDILLRATRQFSISALYAFIDLQSIESKLISISVGDGQVSFYLNGNSSDYSSDPVRISSNAAPIKIKSQHPLLIQMNDNSPQNCLFRATGGIQMSSSAGKSTALLYPSDINHMFAKLRSIQIIFESQESPLYATSLSQNEEISKASLETWAGNAQFMSPHLTNLSEGRIRGAMDWINADSYAPWALIVQTLGDAFTGGLWRLLSSNAYLKSVRWFIVGTGGMLQPRVLQLQVCFEDNTTNIAFTKTDVLLQNIHILGLFCRHHPDVYQNAINQRRKPSLSTYRLLAKNRALATKYDLNSTLSNASEEEEKRPNVVSDKKSSQVTTRDLFTDETVGHPASDANLFGKEKIKKSYIFHPTTEQSDEMEARQLQEASKKSLGQNIGRTPHDLFCENEMLEDAFLVLWHALHNIRSRSTLFVWTPDEEREYKFSLKNNVIEKKIIGQKTAFHFNQLIIFNFFLTTLYKFANILNFVNIDNSSAFFFSITESWYFTIAIGINLCCSFIAAVTAIIAIHRFLLPLLLKDEKEKRILRTASHRLDQEHSVVEQEEWNLIVSTVFWPGHGFLLRWSQGEKEASFVRFYVHFQPAQMPWNQASETDSSKELMDKEVFVYFPYNTVETSHELGLNQKQCFVPVKHPGIIELETSESYSLELLLPYRIRAGGINSQGKVMCTPEHSKTCVVQRSSWSPVVVGDIPLSFLDISSMILNRLFLYNTSSLDIFLKKFVKQVSHFDLSIRLHDLKLQTFGISADIKNKIVNQHYRTTTFKQNSMPRSSLKFLQEDNEISETMEIETSKAPLELKNMNDSSIQHTLPFLKYNYSVRAFFGYKSQQAKELMYKTGRRVFSQVRFEGNPKFCTTAGEGLNQTEAYLEFSAAENAFILRKDRISYNVIGFEVASGTTGQIIAFGYIRFDDLYRVLREKYKTEDTLTEVREQSKNDSGGILDRLKEFCGLNSPKSIHFQDTGMEARFRVGLEYVDGGGPWGRIECSLDTGDMNYFMRHAEPDGEDLETTIQRKHHRKRTGFQPIPELSNLRKEAEERSSQLDFRNDETGAPGPVADENEKSNVEMTTAQNWKAAVSASIAGGGPQLTRVQFFICAAKRFLNANVAIEANKWAVGKTRNKALLLFANVLWQHLQIKLLYNALNTSCASSGVQKESFQAYFLGDSPSQPILQGGDLFVQWAWSNALTNIPEEVYLHLFDHETNKWISSLHWGRPIPNTGSYAWHVDTFFKPEEHCQVVYLALYIEKVELRHCTNLNHHESICQSNAFMIIKPLALSELEFAYAAFCRSFGLEMEHVSEGKLSQLGYSVQESSIKICPDLRSTLCVEPTAEAVHCPGQCVVSTQSKLVLLRSEARDLATPSLEIRQGDTERRVVVYKSISRKIKTVENCILRNDLYWWQCSPDLALLKKELFFSHNLVAALRYNAQKFPVRRYLRRYLRNDNILSLYLYITRLLSVLEYYLEFEWLPILMNFFLMGFQIFFFCLFPLLCIYFVGFRDTYEIVIRLCIRFTNSRKFDKGAALITVWLYSSKPPKFFRQTRRTKRPNIWKVLNGIGVFLIIISTLFFLIFAFSFLLWFLLGALVNSDSFLPYAVMVGSLLFVIGMLWINFLTSREAVIKFIDENMPLLLSLALDHWFDSVHINYASNMEIYADEKLLSYRNKIRDELRECKLRMRRDLHYGMLDEMESLTESKSGISSRLLSQFSFKENEIGKLKKKRERFITFVFEKISSKHSEGFYFSDSGEAKGLEKETWLPTGVRLATVAEAEKFSAKIEDMLVGWEVAMLQDGVKHGPRYGGQSGQCYRYAIAALPRFPPADELEESVKVQLIFDYYNKDGDEFCNEEEFKRMHSELKGYSLEEQKWPDLCEYYNDIVNTNIVPLKGVTLKDLTKIYSLQTGELDRDYEKLFPVIRPDEIDDFDYEEFDQMSEVEDIESEIESTSDYGESNSEEEIEEERWREEEAEAIGRSQRAEKEIKTNINAGKLHFIYNYGTQEHRGQYTDELLTSVAFLASKILETTVKLLSPTFGKETLIGVPLSSAKAIRSNSETIPASGNYEEQSNTTHKSEEYLTDMMKLIHFDLFQELSKQFRLAHAAMFETNNVRNGIADFYDNVMPQKISLKASSQIELSSGEVHWANSANLQSSPPKTASQFVRAVQTYRIEADDTIKELFFIATKSQATLQTLLQLHLFTEMVHTLGILEDSEIVTEIVDVPIERGQVKEQTLLLPKRYECKKVISEAIDKQTATRSQRLSADHILTVAKYIAENYLWFEAFKFLVQMLGIDLDTDELPGGAVKIHHHENSKDYEGNKFITKSSLDKLLSEEFKQSALSTTFEDMEAKQACRDHNLIRLHSVFNQLSSSSGFLAIDLADEAILLLTDNRLNSSGVVACLQHLKIGSIHIKEGDDYSKALEELGIHKGSPVCDITAANDTVTDTFDWTVFRKDPVWTPNLMRAFNRLAAACPGFMGKSQMYEFVREIHKLFQPQVSQMRKGRDRFRGKKKGQKEGIMQLGALNNQYLRIATTGVFNEQLPNIEMNLDFQEEGMRMTSFEMFHKVMLKVGLSVGHKHSRIMWIIICSEFYDEIQQFLSENDIKMGVLRFYLQPLLQFGKKAGPRDSIGDITSYRGYVTYVIFRRIIRKLGIFVPEKGARALWDDLTKDPLNITDFLPDIAHDWQVPTKYLRIEMDKTGMDPTRGRLTSIDTLTHQLPRMLMTGLWPDGIRTLIRLELQWKVSDDHLNFVLSTLERKSNRYGLIKPEEIGVLLSNLSVKGMSFAMLREVIQKMRINMPDKDVKRMFDLMDLNHDLTLSLSELLGGFGVLFGRCMPQLVLEQVGLSYERMLLILAGVLVGLIAFFSFLGLAFSSFESLKSGVSTAVQTLIAILGAVGLQSGASQEITQVKERMRLQIEEIMGDPLSKAKQQVEELQEAIKPESHIKREEKPQKLRYLVPKRCRPELEDPRPCVTFQPGTYVRMEPTISNQVDKSMLRWTIIPRLPQKSALTFSEKTGIIEGFIPLRDSSEFIKAKVEKMDARYLEDLSTDTDRASLTNFSAAAGKSKL
ncbi:EF hand domain-containing protein [Cardiosporidium cionae]|uniref:EF hand domain-containing protein n=1 Tax=Cardiosporidium cionae TaxID=476202 RepID=A0ABQ7JAY7_9APIC|nr:EF hand domain-containing protein [Cardiosporidium cionae]|eukprot:KAF8821115.1 EF hand domain-containing protein [Cardiosporidium cionae]